MKYVSFLLLTVVSTGCFAQSFQKTLNGVIAIVGANKVDIQFYDPSIIRIVKLPKDKQLSKESLSVIAKPEKCDFSATEKNNYLTLKSSKVVVGLDLLSGEIVYKNTSGELLLQEKPNSLVFTPFNDAGRNTFSVSQSFQLQKEEAIYGLGQHQRGKLNQRGQNYHMMMQGNTEDPITFFQSVKGYGIFWDNYSPTTFEDRANETIFKSEVGDCVDYYFMYGGNADGVIAGMRKLTGQVPMFPLWTFGFWQSKERYKSQEEIVGVVKKYRELKVPLDGIIQDWQYWGDNYHWNGMGFLNKEFPQPAQMVNDIHAMNAHAIISIWASFGPQTKPYEELNTKGMLFNFRTWPESGKDSWPPDMNYPSGVRVYDAYDPVARDIYWHYVNKGLFSIGLDGWWMDSSEPDHLAFKDSDLDQSSHLGSFRSVRNAFPLMTVGGVYDHQRKQTSSKRVFILTRSAFAGQQRYGANTWSGDIQSSWSTLRTQIPTGLNFSLSAIPYWNSDIGGFFLNEFKRKLEDPEYRELYTRWLQFGTFCPMMRSHGADAPREIYQFGSKGMKVYDAIEKFINLRYSLLPYVYSTSWDVTSNQSSMMRAMVMDYPKDKKTWDLNNEFLFGKSILVVPVTNPQYLKRVVSGQDSLWAEDFTEVQTTQVYLPAGTNWFDFWTGKPVAGGQTIQRETPLDIIPLYVKAGSIIPFGPNVQYAEEKRWDSLDIRIYPGANGEFVFYEDENDNYNYEKGIRSTITFKWNNASKTFTIGDRKGSFPGMLKSRKFNITVVDENAVQKRSKTISYSGNAVSVKL